MEKFRAAPGAARLPLLIYRLLFPVAFVAMLPGIVARMFRRGNFRNRFGERFGLFSPEVLRKLEPGGWTWIHAVSVGEMIMGLKLARTLQATEPGLRVLLSTTTSTGFELANKQLGPGIELIYYPLDIPSVIRRVLRIVRPARLVLVDKELWPNLVTECHRRSIPVSIVNARLSPKSERGFLKWRRWVAPFFAMLDNVCVQEPEDVERWSALGVRSEALHCTGSLKFDFAAQGESRAAEFAAILRGIGVNGDTPILLGGSTFPGEEALLCRVLLAVRERLPRAFLILVPRHVERTPEVEADVRAAGLRFTLRQGESASGERPDVLIVNTTGELRDWYAVATVCFVGKSMLAKGGQNPAEPVLAGRPVVFGPCMENFAALVRQFLAVGGALQARDETELAEMVSPLLADPARGRDMADRARAVLQVHFGATERTAALMLAS